MSATTTLSAVQFKSRFYLTTLTLVVSPLEEMRTTRWLSQHKIPAKLRRMTLTIQGVKRPALEYRIPASRTKLVHLLASRYGKKDVRAVMRTLEGHVFADVQQLIDYVKGSLNPCPPPTEAQLEAAWQEYLQQEPVPASTLEPTPEPAPASEPEPPLDIQWYDFPPQIELFVEHNFDDHELYAWLARPASTSKTCVQFESHALEGICWAEALQMMSSPFHIVGNYLAEHGYYLD